MRMIVYYCFQLIIFNFDGYQSGIKLLPIKLDNIYGGEAKEFASCWHQVVFMIWLQQKLDILNNVKKAILDICNSIPVEVHR